MRLFGVDIKTMKNIEDDAPSKSLETHQKSTSGEKLREDGDCYDFPAANPANRRKKVIHWSGEEHRKFLAGLEKYGRGSWVAISREFVITRTPSQVASHAQKHFLRKSARKYHRRSSLFDMPFEDPSSSPVSHDLSLSISKTKDDPLKNGTRVVSDFGPVSYLVAVPAAVVEGLWKKNMIPVLPIPAEMSSQKPDFIHQKNDPTMAQKPGFVSQNIDPTMVWRKPSDQN